MLKCTYSNIGNTNMNDEHSVASRISKRLSGETPSDSYSVLAPIYVSKEEWNQVSLLQGSDRQAWKQQHGLTESDAARVDLFSEDEKGDSVVEAFIVDVNEDFGTIRRDESEKLKEDLANEGKVVEKVAEAALSQTVEVPAVEHDPMEQFYRELDGLSKSIYEYGADGVTKLEQSQKEWKNINDEFTRIYRAESLEVVTSDRLYALAHMIAGLGSNLAKARVSIGTALNHSKQLEQSGMDTGRQADDESDKALSNEVAHQYGNTISQTNNVYSRVTDLVRMLPDFESYIREASQNMPDIRGLEDYLSFAVKKVNAINELMNSIDTDTDDIYQKYLKLRESVIEELAGKR